MSYPYRKDVSKKKMGRCLKIALAFIVIILGVSFCAFLLSTDVAQMAFNNPTREEDYVLLEENAMEVARTLDKNSLSDETLSADFYFEETELTVEVKSIKAKVIARIPVLSKSINVKNETIEYSTNVDMENVKYERENLQKPSYVYLFLDILGSCLVIILFYRFVFPVWTY